MKYQGYTPWMKIRKDETNMKKLTALFLSLALVLGLAACGSNRGTDSSTLESTSAEISVPESIQTTQPEPTASEESHSSASSEASQQTTSDKTLVVYYSATGNTQEAAGYIAEATGGDLFALEPVEPYTDDDLNWTNDSSRVTREHEDESLRDVALVADTVENWDEYGTVFIGYPIWWGIAAWPVDGFVEANDFTGKTVIPFCTSSSSGLGQSGELLAEMAGTGDWQEGMRFRSGVSQTDVQSWIDSLGL